MKCCTTRLISKSRSDYECYCTCVSYRLACVLVDIFALFLLGLFIDFR